jgi:hypothetical protein
MSRNRQSLVVVVLWALLIFFTSSYYINAEEWVRIVSSFRLGEGFNRSFRAFWMEYGVFLVKGWHAAEFALLFLFIIALLLRTTQLSITGASRVTLFATVLYAASDEWHQTFIPGRDGCVRDVLIDAAGALVAMAGFLMWARRKRKVDNRATTSLANKWRG